LEFKKRKQIYHAKKGSFVTGVLSAASAAAGLISHAGAASGK